MRNAGLSLVCLLALVFSIPLLSSCSSSGPTFTKESIPDNGAMVYVYRPGKSVGGELKNYVVEANGRKVAGLHKGTYAAYTAKPGLVEFKCTSGYTSFVRANIEAGKMYYVKLILEKGPVVPRPRLEIVPANTGESEASRCNLIK
ncbi:MAG: hypothetical protein GY941_27655 [Planctomycetes bacterium]|nr:hypothetical protein [Planctomycetota bacterium]